MLKAYLDTNAIQLATGAFPTPESLETILTAAGYELSLGGHVMYELAKAFITRRGDTQPCLAVLAGMERIHYVPQPQALIRGEVLQLRHGGKPLHVVSVPMAAAIRSGLYFLARGHVGRARSFIADREKRFEIGHAEIASANRDMIRSFLRANPTLRTKLRTFPDFRAALRPLWPRIVRTVAGRLPWSLLERIFVRPSEFPILNTLLNGQLHLMYLSGLSNALPSRGRVDDYRNVLESNAADLFVTNDARLLKRFREINPFRTAVAWQDFMLRLRSAAP